MGKNYLKPLHVNDLCPRGWAWVIGDCTCPPDEGDCNDCAEPLAPIVKDGYVATWARDQGRMSAFEKITGITLYDEEKVLDLCEGDKVVASYEVIDSKDTFEEGFTSQWKLKWFKEAEDK